MRALEHFHKLCSVFGVKKEVLAVDDRDGLEGRFGSHEQTRFSSRSMTAEDLLDLAPHRFDGIEVWRIRRQIQKPGALGLDGFADSPDFVRGEIVHDHQVAGSQGGRQSLRHPGQKHFAIHGAFKKPRGARTLQAYARDQRAGLIASVRDASYQSPSPEGPAAQTRHLGIGPAFIHKDQPSQRFRSQLVMPSRSFFGHVRPVLFGGGQSFFYTSSPAAEAINRSWKFGRAGPCERPTRLAWRRADPTAALAAAVCVPW